MTRHIATPLRAALTLLLLLTGLLVESSPRSVVTIANASTSWTGASAAGSGAAPWETAYSIGLGGGVGVSVNVANGNLIVHTPGIYLPGVNGLNEEIAPLYNSFSHSNSGDFGYGWLMGTGRDVGLVAGNGTITFYDRSGHTWAFTQVGSTFTSPVGIDAQLIQNSDGSYTLTANASGDKLQFTSDGFLLAEQNREGNSITYSYDTNHRLQMVINTEGQATTLSYNAQNEVSQIADVADRTWTYGYDGNNNLTSITDKLNHVIQFGYNASDQLIQVTDPKGNITLISYSGAAVSQIKRVTNTQANTGPAWSFSYGTTTQVTDPNSHTTGYTVDSANRVTKVTHPDATATQYTWTADNHLATEQEPSGATTTWSYDANNNLTQVQLPTGAKATWAYTDTAHPYQPSSATDTQGNTTSVVYTTSGLPQTVTDALGHQRSLSYNSDGTVASSTDENNHTTTYGYTNGLPSSVLYPHVTGSVSPLGSTSVTYNSFDVPASTTDGKGQTENDSFDAAGRMTGSAFLNADGSTGPSYSYSFDANSNGTTESDTMGSTTSTTTYVYNALDQVAQEQQPSGRSVNYSWDGVDNLLSKTDPGGSIAATYTYSVNDELKTVTDPLGAQTTFSYDQDGNRTQIAYPNGVTEAMSYDSAGQLIRIGATNSSNTVLNSFNYSYVNPATGLQTTQRYQVQPDGGATYTNYRYDALNRLTSAVTSQPSPPCPPNPPDGYVCDPSPPRVTASYYYGYDNVGNMTSKTANGTATSMSYNVVDQLTSAGATNYTYDANGNVSTVSGGNSLAYNALDQTTSITPNGSSAVPMAYKGSGQSERTGSGATAYEYDSLGLVSISANNQKTYVTYSPDGDLLSERIPGGASGCTGATGTYCTYYYLFDGLGSVVALTDNTGTVQNTYAYDPYGKTVSATGSVPNPFMYIGAIWDSATSLYEMGERFYDPGVGRFTQQDPLGSQSSSVVAVPSIFSTYAYAGDNPCTTSDPSGLRPSHSGKTSHHHRKTKRGATHKSPRKTHKTTRPPFGDTELAFDAIAVGCGGAALVATAGIITTPLDAVFVPCSVGAGVGSVLTRIIDRIWP